VGWGLKNYGEILGKPPGWPSRRRGTASWAFNYEELLLDLPVHGWRGRCPTWPSGVTVGLVLALILNTKDSLPPPGVYRVLLILPLGRSPNYITALIWKGMFSTSSSAW